MPVALSTDIIITDKEDGSCYIRNDKRYADVYPNAHNKGQTFELSVKTFGVQYSEKFLGADWTQMDAFCLGLYFVRTGNTGGSDFGICGRTASSIL